MPRREAREARHGAPRRRRRQSKAEAQCPAPARSHLCVGVYAHSSRSPSAPRMGCGHRNTPPQGGPPPRDRGRRDNGEQHPSPTRRTQWAPNGIGAGHVSPSRPQETRRRIGHCAPGSSGRPYLGRGPPSFVAAGTQPHRGKDYSRFRWAVSGAPESGVRSGCHSSHAPRFCI
ncbi:hypothetical protein NDU88_002765 [Pleurodeles waltl]|uniref:Uncharacterized protein n=1 Tax=Pleurodeles waltl TaxID=8319 RepID=A0AAV7LDB0_PLEWA|nr:hypothetical protein NDU88_002765 [Pleurodeles waltl]